MGGGSVWVWLLRQARADCARPGVPEHGVPQPGVPEPGVPEPGIPEPGVPEPGVPEPGVPEPGVPEPGVPEPGTFKDTQAGSVLAWLRDCFKGTSPFTVCLFLSLEFSPFCFILYHPKNNSALFFL